MSTSYQSQYANITKRLLENPKKIGDSRIGKINSRFAEQIRVDLKKEFPLQEIKKVKASNIIHELIWMIKGDTNIKYLIENGCHIWTDDAFRYYKENYTPQPKDDTQTNIDFEISKEEFVKRVLNGDSFKYDHIPLNRILNRETKEYVFGDLDRIYGQQWRNFNGKTDQLQNCIDTLINNPDDRRMIVTAHNPTDIEDKNVGLPSCHNYFQFYTTINKEGKRELSTFVNIRSNDWFLGQPYNMAQYAMLTHIIANIVNMEVNELVILSVDAHLYHAHFDAAKEWLERYEKIGDDAYYWEQGNETPEMNVWGCKSKLKFNREKFTIDDLTADDIEIVDYESQGFIKAPLLT